MKKIVNEFNEAVYHYQTSSQLKVQYLHRPGFKKSAAILAVPFGALNIKQIYNGQEIQHPLGVAHFLEHKVFEDEKEDILSQFSKLGGSANAFTSYQETMYYFTHETELFAPLNLLLQFVRRFDIDTQSVEKEKPIIVEEIKMYEQMPEMRLLAETYRNTFHKFPYIYDIAGTEASVNATTLEDLQTAYRLNYADEQMVLVLVSNQDPQTVFDFIEEKTKERKATHFSLENVYPDEDKSVVHSFRQQKDRTKSTKMSLTYKFHYPQHNHLLDEMLLRIALEMNFSDLNEDYQKALDAQIISDYFAYDVDVKEDFGVIYFFNESENSEAFKRFIDDKMNRLDVDEVLFKQIKRKTYGDMIFSLSNPERLAINMARFALQENDYFSYMQHVKNFEFSQIKAVLAYLEDKDCSFFVLSPQED